MTWVGNKGAPRVIIPAAVPYVLVATCKGCGQRLGRGLKSRQTVKRHELANVPAVDSGQNIETVDERPRSAICVSLTVDLFAASLTLRR